MVDINANTGEGLDTRALASGTDVIGIFASGTLPTVVTETTPTDSSKINFATTLLYSGTLIGSLVKTNPAGGSFVQVLVYDASDNIINVGSWI